ncbi:MAG TPA: amidase family protein [Acidobacteriota bacterium]|nr:amidase family protein [Acidobacteriota bacterium]
MRSTHHSVVGVRRAAWSLALSALLAAAALPATVAAQTLKLSAATVADINAALDAGTLTSEALVQQYLARIDAYDERGPELNAVLWLNDGALDTARTLDRERRESGPRSRLHGVPVVLKDNVDTHDLPTTAGSVLLAGSIPPDDAFIVQKLRAAGAIILAKVNMSEFASGVPLSSIGGYTRNPHSLTRTPSGSSGGTGVAIAAAFGQMGIGTDTGGSVRGPSTANGIVGLKTTHGLLSRDGIVPLGLSFDTAGPMARHVYDVAAMLSAMTGVDAADESTRKSDGKVMADYTSVLDATALEGARVGIARDFLGQDGEVDWVIEASLQRMRDAGADVVDVAFPAWLLEARGEMYTTIRWREFRVQIAEYLSTLGDEYPKTLAELVERSQKITASTAYGAQPNPTRWALMQREEESGDVTDSEYLAVRDHGLAMVRTIVEGLLDESDLDAIVYPTRPTRPSLVEGSSGAGGRSVTNIANLTGFPDLSVPAGFTSNRLPVNISFLGTAFAEARLLAIGYAFEQLTQARRDPAHTPSLPGEGIEQ